MHLWPPRGQNLGPLQDMPPVPGARHPHRQEANTSHCTTHRMADTVPGNPKARHHPQSDEGTQGGPRGACPHRRLYPAMHPGGRLPGNSSTHAMDGRRQNGQATHVLHPQVTAACRRPFPRQTRPTSSHLCSTNRETPTSDLPPKAGPHRPVRAPSIAHDTNRACTSTIDTTHTPASMRTPRGPVPPRHHRSRGTANPRPRLAHSVYANGYHRRCCPATQTTGSAYGPHTASTTAPTARTSTPTTSRSPQPQPCPPA